MQFRGSARTRQGHGMVPEQRLRECANRGIVEPEMIRQASIRLRGRDRRPVHFRRFRNRRGLKQPDTSGSFWKLRVPECIEGPLALGFGCHFGLGTFKPDPEAA